MLNTAVGNYIFFSTKIQYSQSFTDDDNFFLVGGDSFKLLKLHNKFVQEFSLDLSLSDLLRNLTIKKVSGN